MAAITVIEVLGVCAALSLFVALWARPAGIFAVLYALVIVGTAILVVWHVAEHRQERTF